MVKDGRETVIFIKTRQRARCELKQSWRKDREIRQVVILTSNCLSRRDVNSATTMLDCSRPGTYAFPYFKNTFRDSTRSGTRSQSTLNQVSSSLLAFQVGIIAASSAANSVLSSSVTGSHQSRFRLETKADRSERSSLPKRSRNSMVSTRLNRLRRSSVDEKASRKMK